MSSVHSDGSVMSGNTSQICSKDYFITNNPSKMASKMGQWVKVHATQA